MVTGESTRIMTVRSGTSSKPTDLRRPYIASDVLFATSSSLPRAASATSRLPTPLPRAGGPTTESCCQTAAISRPPSAMRTGTALTLPISSPSSSAMLGRTPPDAGAPSRRQRYSSATRAPSSSQRSYAAKSAGSSAGVSARYSTVSWLMSR